MKRSLKYSQVSLSEFSNIIARVLQYLFDLLPHVHCSISDSELAIFCNNQFPLRTNATHGETPISCNRAAHLALGSIT